MANNVIILGKSGSGKSTSIRDLNPKETVVINTLNKRLPFKGSNGMYSASNKNGAPDKPRGVEFMALTQNC